MVNEKLYPELAPMDAEVLLDVAAKAVQHGLREGKPMPVAHERYSANLRDCWPVKVSLAAGERPLGAANLQQRTRPLVSNVAGLVYAAAFLDRKSPGVRAEDLDQLSVRITVLGLPLQMAFVRESDVMAMLQPEVDALAISHQQRRAMLWPDAWLQHPTAKAFMAALKGKVGLEADQWHGTLRLERYCSVAVEGSLSRERDREGRQGDILGGSAL
jgi:AMMECR1 domain-containing protein